MAEQDAGIALIVLGVVLMATAIVFPPLCGLGILLLIVGIILMAVGPSQRAYYAPPYGPYPYAPQPPPVAPAGPPCPVCGNPLTWVPQYNRWYCPRCQDYR